MQCPRLSLQYSCCECVQYSCLLQFETSRSNTAFLLDHLHHKFLHHNTCGLHTYSFRSVFLLVLLSSAYGVLLNLLLSSVLLRRLEDLADPCGAVCSVCYNGVDQLCARDNHSIQSPLSMHLRLHPLLVPQTLKPVLICNV